MEGYVKRMQREKRELYNKIQRLTRFLSAQSKEGYPDISTDELFLMGQQLAHMTEYYKILDKRIVMHIIDL